MQLLISAGPTREPIDPVRFISNRSSGKMGYALARAALRRGHDVVLVSGPVALPAPAGADMVYAITAADMLDALRRHVPHCETLIMAAAVADWRPRQVAAQKLKKRTAPLTLELEPVPDILSALAPEKGARLFVGFAAETEDVEAEARRKLVAKGLDLIVANNVAEPDSGFEVDTNRVTLIAADGWKEALPLLTKDAVAERILEWVEAASAGATGAGG